MNTYKIIAGNTESVYSAETEAAAVAAYILDAGYSSIAEAADACGQTVDEFVADLTVRKE